jgi:hypothetical protein
LSAPVLPCPVCGDDYHLTVSGYEGVTIAHEARPTAPSETVPLPELKGCHKVSVTERTLLSALVAWNALPRIPS